MRLATKLMIAELTRFAAYGFTMQETATETNLSYAAVSMYSRKYGIKFRRPKESIPSGRSERMAALYKSGRTLEQIGVEYGVTRERVRQIINKHHGLTAKHGGATKIAKDKRKQFYADRDARSMKKWGCPWSQYVLLRDAVKPVRAFHSQRQNAATRGISFELTLWQWWTIWQESGHWDERGRGRGYHMCRRSDLGPYSVSNVYIATGVENMQDYWAAVRGGVKPRSVHCNSHAALSPEDLKEAQARAKEALKAAALRYQSTPKYKLRVSLRRQGLPKEQRDAIVAAHFGASA